MSETTILAIITVACTAGIPFVTTLIKTGEAAISSHLAKKRALKERQIKSLEEYAEIVFRCSGGTEDGKPYRQMGNIYLYINRSEWYRIDKINEHLNNYDRKNAVKEFSELLNVLKLPKLYIKSTNSKKAQAQSSQQPE